MRPKTVNTKLLQSVTEVYYKVRQVLQSASDITKCDRLLLQSASGITKCDRLLLQSASVITKCDSYYKVRRNTLQCLCTICLNTAKIIKKRQEAYGITTEMNQKVVHKTT